MATAPALSSRLVWAGYLAMIVGNFMAILDIQIVASSLREIAAGVSASAEEIAWVQTSYLIAEVIAIPLSGLLGRAISMRLLFVISALGFSVMSVACAFAWDLESLIVFRALQGFLGGGMIPTTMAALFLLFPQEKRGNAIVLVGMVSTLAPSIGPSLGGWITDSMGWEWLFLINIVPGLICGAMVWRFSPLRSRDLSLLRTLDVLGLVGMALFLGSLEFVLDEGPAHDWFDDGTIRLMAFLAVAGGLLFFWRAFTSPHPIVDLRVYGNRNFMLGCLFSVAVGAGLFGSVYLVPLFLGGVRGYTASDIGSVMMMTGIAMFVTAPIVARIQNKVDFRLLLFAGLGMTAVALWLNAQLTAESSFWEFALPQALRGSGLIICMIPMTGMAIGTLAPERVQNATGLFTLNRNLGGALGVAIINTWIVRYQDVHRSELASAVSSGQGDVQGWLDAAAAQLQAQGVADPGTAALARLAALVDREAAVMAFNDIFLSIALVFASLLPLVLLARQVPRAPVRA